jgi:ferritin-like metal-binding protein YciE
MSSEKSLIGGKEMAVRSLENLLIDELRDLLSAEKQITKALPKMAKAASSEELRAGFEEHLTQTQGQIARLEQAFEILGHAARAKKCVAMEGLIEEGKEFLEEEMEPSVMDAALIAAAQKVEHYEIASYGSARTWAQEIGQDQVAELLQATLDEEAETDRKLSKLAGALVNQQAA